MHGIITMFALTLITTTIQGENSHDIIVVERFMAAAC
jgi:hypothetical protein